MKPLITGSHTAEGFFTLLRGLFSLGVLHWKKDFFGVLQGVISRVFPNGMGSTPLHGSCTSSSSGTL